ncbi:alpha--glucan [Moniliophthora roreri]|nr:alpha--glucan [Moniliophthora roreri]
MNWSPWITFNVVTDVGLAAGNRTFYTWTPPTRPEQDWTGNATNEDDVSVITCDPLPRRIILPRSTLNLGFDQRAACLGREGNEGDIADEEEK